MTTNTCRYVHCESRIEQGMYLCRRHWPLLKRGIITKCRDCADFKEARYDQCTTCFQGNQRQENQRQEVEAAPPKPKTRPYFNGNPNSFDEKSRLLEDDQKARDKRQLFHDQQMRCVYCGNVYKYYELEMDHIIPRKLGGPDNIRNAQLACQSCNIAKGTLTDIEFRQKHRGILPQRERTPANPPVNPSRLSAATMPQPTRGGVREWPPSRQARP